MAKIAYISKRFRGKTLEIIEAADAMLSEYARLGFVVTVRTLFYQFVVKNLLPNSEKSYRALQNAVNNGRHAGLIDWGHITDQTRHVRSISHFDCPVDILDAAVESYAVDSWACQHFRPEVWVEKDALVGVLEDECNELDVPLFSCRGFVSTTELWGAGQRLSSYQEDGQTPIVFHLGDHDPSGLDMTRVIREQLSLFAGKPITVRRLALNFEQVQKLNLPPNPAKEKDTRTSEYKKTIRPCVLGVGRAGAFDSPTARSRGCYERPGPTGVVYHEAAGRGRS